MTDSIPTVDHDQHPAPVYSGPVAPLVRVQIDRHCWAMLLPGDQVAELLIGLEGKPDA